MDSEPFVSVIKSGEVLIIQGDAPRDTITDFGLPFPDDVTYVPLKTENGVIGIFAIEAVIHNRNMLELVTTLANLAAVAIESARLLEDTRRRATEMQNLYNLGVEVSRMLDVRQVMSSVIGNTLNLVDCHLGAVMFLDEQTNQYVIENAAATTDIGRKFGLSSATFIDAREARENVKILWTQLAKEITTRQQPVSFVRSKSGDTDDPLEDVAAKLGVQAVLGVPIYVQNQIDGAIFAASLEPRSFDSRDVQTLAFVANQASVSLRNAQLVQRLNLLTEELEQRVAQRTEELAQTLQHLTDERDRVGTLYQIARELSSSFDLDRVLNEALNLLNRAISISQGSILLQDRETEYLMYRAALGRYKPLPRGGIETPYKIGYGLAGKVMEYRAPRLVADLREEPDWVPVEETGVDERRSAIVVPLSTGDDTLGVIMLFHPEPNKFTQDQLKLVNAASAQIATAVNNAQLYRLITDQAKRLGTLYRQQSAEAAKNQAILESITDGVLVIDADNKLVLVNPKAAEILNIDSKDVENQPLRQILGRSESPVELKLTQLLYDNLNDSLEKIVAGSNSVQFRIESGAKVVVVSLAPVSLGTEERPSTVAVIRDISKEAEVDRLKNEFISTVSHELRTPMTSIKGYADLLLSGNAKIGNLNETQHKFISVIQSNANRLTELVNDILEISRIETGRVRLEFESIDISKIVLDVSTSFRGQMVKKQMDLNLHLPDHLPKVYADKARLTQVLVNLVGNAWQYTPEGGEISVHVKQVGNFLQVDVSDSGIGIVEKDVAYIFDRFFRSERHEVQIVDGTGLGLSITRSFVELLGGQIWVKSQLDVGTTFSFTVPLDTGADDAPWGKQVLVTFSDPQLIELLKPGFEASGYRVISTANMQETLDLVQQAKNTLSAILLDGSTQDVNSFALLEQLTKNEAINTVPLFLASLKAGTKGVRPQIVDSIVPNAAEDHIVSVANRVAGTEDVPSIRLKQSPVTPRVLVIDHNRKTTAWLREVLDNNGFEVHCAYNSQQGFDMVLGNLPHMIFLNTSMPDLENESLIALLYQDGLTTNIPIVLISEDIEFSKKSGVTILGSAHWQKNKPYIPVKELVREIDQVKLKAIKR
jgi:PAS domain S-box-containing protein